MSMSIKWAALAETAGISFAVTVATVVVFSLGIMALSRREAALESGDAGSAKGTVALGAAGLCFAACASVVGYGLYLIAA
ncbi:hypothetical protein ACIRBX_21435 [Kitasatospora sp. NPDC096147]|uniref:hypothetical protein n=1 Tax=Kitasatospora sp. NPDC096147 TaxID=3364093 RepID=UPI003805E582